MKIWTMESTAKPNMDSQAKVFAHCMSQHLANCVATSFVFSFSFIFIHFQGERDKMCC